MTMSDATTQRFVAADDGVSCAIWTADMGHRVVDLDDRCSWNECARAALWLSEAGEEGARAVLGWAHCEGGRAPGGFTTKLLDACANADEEHLDLLALGFPHLVAAYRIYGRIPGSPKLLADFAEAVS